MLGSIFQSEQRNKFYPPGMDILDVDSWVLSMVSFVWASAKFWWGFSEKQEFLEPEALCEPRNRDTESTTSSLFGYMVGIKHWFRFLLFNLQQPDQKLSCGPCQIYSHAKPKLVEGISNGAFTSMGKGGDSTMRSFFVLTMSWHHQVYSAMTIWTFQEQQNVERIFSVSLYLCTLGSRTVVFVHWTHTCDGQKSTTCVWQIVHCKTHVKVPASYEIAPLCVKCASFVKCSSFWGACRNVQGDNIVLWLLESQRQYLRWWCGSQSASPTDVVHIGRRI